MYASPIRNSAQNTMTEATAPPERAHPGQPELAEDQDVAQHTLSTRPASCSVITTCGRDTAVLSE